MTTNTSITNFCPHVPPGEPPCAACRGETFWDGEGVCATCGKLARLQNDTCTACRDDFCRVCGGHVAYDDSGLCAACLIVDLYRKLTLAVLETIDKEQAE